MFFCLTNDADMAAVESKTETKTVIVQVRPIVYVLSPKEQEQEIKVADYEAEIDLLAHLIYAEAGSDWCSDKMQQNVGSVVLNRIAHESYPNTLMEVVYQSGQYGCVYNGMINYDYNERAYNNAKYLFENGSQLPANVVFQAQFKQGDGVYEVFNHPNGDKTYFCYKGE